MSIAIPFFSNKLPVSGNGKYRATFSVNSWLFSFNMSPGDTKFISGKQVTILDVVQDKVNDKLIVTYQVADQDPTHPSQASAASAIAIALIVLAGIGILFLSLDKVEKIIDTPGGQVALVGGSLLIIVILFLGIVALWKFVLPKAKA